VKCSVSIWSQSLKLVNTQGRMSVEKQILLVLFRVRCRCVPQSTLVVWKRGMIPHLDEVAV